MKRLCQTWLLNIGAVRPLSLILVFLAIYLAATLYRAQVKPFWYDELFTFYISGQGGPVKIWAALRAGLDPNPPLMYASTYISQALFGFGHIATRIPAILGFLLLLISVYRFASLRLPAQFAQQAMVFVALTGAYNFAYEARAYGLLLGIGGLALTFWQRRQPGALAAALSVMHLTHCYSVLMLPPLFVGEFVRTWGNRKIDRAVWLALILPCGIVLGYLPMLRSAEQGQLAGPIFDPTFYRLIGCYRDILGPAFWPASVTLVWIAAVTLLRRPKPRESFAKHEWAALGVLALAPAMAFIVSNIVRSGYFTRYGLGACIPVAIGIAWLSYAMAGPERRHSHFLPVLAIAWFVGVFAWELRAPVPSTPGPELDAWLRSGATPLIVADGQTFLELDHYLDAQAAARLVFLTDRDSALRYMRTDCYDGALRAVRPWFPIRGRLVPYGEFLTRREPFLVYGKVQPQHSWILRRLKDEGISYRVQAVGDGKQLIAVTP